MFLINDSCFSGVSMEHFTAIEGMLLYRALVVVFDSSEEHNWLLCLSAYGVSVTITVSTLIINLVQSKGGESYFYYREDACWLAQNYDWAFKGPVLLIVIVNTAILVLGLYKAYIVSRYLNIKILCINKKGVLKLQIFVWRFFFSRYNFDDPGLNN